MAGVNGGFTQANHGKAAHLQLLHKGDAIFFYSPGTLFRAGEILQAFTAVARVTDEVPYDVELSPGVHVSRRKVAALSCEEHPIEALILQLDFIQDKAHWGLSLRRGMLEIGYEDARRIASAMHADIG